jgi:hypothetical protein
MPVFYFLKIHFNIRLKFTPRYSMFYTFPQVCPLKYSTHLYSHPRLLNAPTSHYSCFNHPNDFRRRIHIIQLLAIWPFPPPCYFAALSPKYFPQHCSRTFSAYVPPSMWEASFTPLQNNKVIFFFVLIFIFWDIWLTNSNFKLATKRFNYCSIVRPVDLIFTHVLKDFFFL